MSALPFHTYLWKVASRCNIDCTYCYVYNLGDETWKTQPHLMSPKTAQRVAERMREHLELHRKTDASIVFHGGEPMMLGAARMSKLVQQIRSVFEDSKIELTFGMQSNLLLFSEDIGEVMTRARMSVGVSIDGPPRINDLHRIDRKGRGTGVQLEQKLQLLLSERFRNLFAGFLCVIDIDVAPEEVLDYLLMFNPRSIDFLLPLNNHDSRPKGKTASIEATPYGDWLIRCFNRWVESGSKTRIRFFNSIIQMLCGRATSVESLGLLPVDIIVIETNGDIDAVDALKAAFPGAARLGFSVFQNNFEEVALHSGVRARQMGAESLCERCRRCDLVDVCGGGYLPHRYGSATGFDNPSVYCADLMKLIRHIKRMIAEEIRISRSNTSMSPIADDLVVGR